MDNGIKVGEWVAHAINQTYEEEQGVDLEVFAEFMEEYPTKEFIINSFLGLRENIEAISKKLDKPWWKFWV